MEDRPLVSKLLEVEEYKEKYHSYLAEIVKLIKSGVFKAEIDKTDLVISEYVKNDARATCTHEQYKTAIETLKEICSLRALSIQGQLDGTIPSTTEGQKENRHKLIPVIDINLRDTGGMGGGMRNMWQKEEQNEKE